MTAATARRLPLCPCVPWLEAHKPTQEQIIGSALAVFGLIGVIVTAACAPKLSHSSRVSLFVMSGLTSVGGVAFAIFFPQRMDEPRAEELSPNQFLEKLKRLPGKPASLILLPALSQEFTVAQATRALKHLAVATQGTELRVGLMAGEPTTPQSAQLVLTFLQAADSLRIGETDDPYPVQVNTADPSLPPHFLLFSRVLPDEDDFVVSETVQRWLNAALEQCPVKDAEGGGKVDNNPGHVNESGNQRG